MASSTRTQRRQTLITGPFKGVQNTDEPYDDTPDKLVDALNCYIPDPDNGSEVLARPGMGVVNPSSALTAPGQGVFTHIDINGNAYNFIASGGKLYRYDSDLINATDVTPGGSPISSAVRRVYFTSFIGQLVISDGVNRPWVATNLSSTPVTRTAIDFDGAGTAWAAYGQPEVYGGSIFFVLDNVGGVLGRLDIAWSNPGDPLTGYQQTNYDFRWTLQQTGTGAVYAIIASNVALFYFRDGSIGAITGTPGPDLQQTATHDAIAVNVGALQSATIHTFGNNVFFCDVSGKPWMMPLGSPPIPIWLQLRSIVDSANSTYPAVTAQVSCATILPGLNLYIAAIWAPVAGVVSPPTEMQIFDAKSGTYVGRWSLVGGATVEALGVLNNTAGRGSLVIVGSQVNGASPAGGYVWTQNTLMAGGTPITTEDSVIIVTEGGLELTTDSVVPSWLDNTSVPDIQVTTQRLGYSADFVWNVDSATVITGTTAPCEVSMISPTTSGTVTGTPQANPSDDRTYRLVVGADIQGRGTQVVVSPTTADSQWRLYSVGITALPSRATAEES